VVFNKIEMPDMEIMVDIVTAAPLGCKTLQLEKANTEIYIMNNDGKTIDKHIWWKI
jgi:hypothetical protein